MSKSKPYVLGLICARGGSKGVPRKNLRHLKGKPLVGWAIEAALSSKLVDRVIVSTEDPEIASVSRKYGADVPFVRPLELAQDDSLEWYVWQHTLRMLEKEAGRSKIDVLACVPATSPLREGNDIDACIKLLLESDADVVITVAPLSHNPYFNMITLDKDGYAKKVGDAEKTVSRRQDAPVVFGMTSVAYAARADFVLRADSKFKGKVKVLIVPEERAIDIDTELDLKFAEFLLDHN